MLVMRFNKNTVIKATLWLAVLFTIVSGVFSSPAVAASSEWNITDHTRVRLISATNTIGNNDTITLGLQFELKKDWKVYWRSAGDAGYPPSIDWTGSSNLKKAVMHWPAPERFSILGFETLGYKKEIVFPLIINLENLNDDLSIKANVDYLACAELCIPYEAKLEIFIPKRVLIRRVIVVFFGFLSYSEPQKKSVFLCSRLLN